VQRKFDKLDVEIFEGPAYLSQYGFENSGPNTMQTRPKVNAMAKSNYKPLLPLFFVV